MHVGLKGPSPSVPGAPRTRVAQQYGVALCAAWGLVVRAAYEHWDWRSTLAGKNVLTAIDAFVASSTGARPVPCLDSCQPWRAFPPPPTRKERVANSIPQGLAVPAWGKEAASALEGTPVLGATDTVAGEESPKGVSKAAKRYLEACRVEYSSEALQQAVKLGSELLRLSGSVEKAAGALNRERVALLGNHLSFTEEGHVIGISDLHKAYLIEMAQQGAPSSGQGFPSRLLDECPSRIRIGRSQLRVVRSMTCGSVMSMDPSSTTPQPRNPATPELPGKLSGGMPAIRGSPCVAQRGMSLEPSSGIFWRPETSPNLR